MSDTGPYFEDMQQKVAVIMDNSLKLLDIKENRHVVVGLITEEVILNFAVGVASMKMPLERMCHAAQNDKDILSELGLDSVLGMFTASFSAPDGPYEEVNLGYLIEVCYLGDPQNGGMARYAMKLPPPGVDAQIQVWWVEEFPWETTPSST